MAIKRLNLNWGGYKDGVSFRLPTSLYKNNKADFLGQAEVQKLRTARVVTRDAEGFVKVADTADEVPMGLIVMGFLDKLDTHEDYNGLMVGDGEGMAVAIGRYGVTLPLSEDIFDGDLTAVKAGQKVFSTEGKDGKMAFEAGAVEIGYVSLVDGESVTIEVKF
jgi:hypothetical protein